MVDESRYVVLIGADSDATISRLRARRVRYVIKRLNSRPSNWESAARLIEADGALAVIVKLNRHNLEQMTAVGGWTSRELYAAHSDVAPRLLRAIASIPHLVMLHEDIGQGADWASETPAGWMYAGDEYEETLAPETQRAAFRLFESCETVPTFYRRNAEADELAALFVEDVESNLLLRLYIPADRLYADEASRLLDMFRDWLVTAQRLQIRRSGYRTSRGEVVEFYSESELTREGMQARVGDFRQFIDLLSEPEAAAVALEAVGVERDRARTFVDKNARALRRMQTDMRHEHERRTLALRQSAEADLLEEVGLKVPLESVGFLVERLFGNSPNTIARGQGDELKPVSIHHQVVHVAGSMYQFTGDTAAADLVKAIEELKADNGLVTMVHELGDSETPGDRRAAAAAGLRSFLLRSRDRIEAEAFKVLSRWVESQTGF
ncbi:hypothetical protein [Marisediminicola sp. LYQ134]|uniref:hypothetical protein n=1 Tax=Marisediminicola sp. LYQ134 TaxID=3391061 RepID=UPI0039831CD0